MDRVGGKLALCIPHEVKGSYWILPKAHDCAIKKIFSRTSISLEVGLEARARPRSSAQSLGKVWS